MTYQPIGNKLNKIQQSGGYQPLNIRYETIPTKEQIGKGEAFTRAAAFQAVPTTGAIASGVAGAKGGALLGSFAGPIGASVGAVVGGVGGGILGAVLTSKAQEKALEIVKGNEWMTKKQEQLSQARKDQPLASFAGEVAPQLLTLKPSPKTVGSALKFAQNILTNPKSVTAILKTPAGRAQLDDLVNVSIGGSAELGTEVYTQAKEGDFNALRLIAAGTVGSLINQPNRFGMRLGMKPSGEIEFTPDNVAPDVTPRLDVSAEVPVRPQEAPQQALKAVDDTLLQEARKYKTAEEFVNNRPVETDLRLARLQGVDELPKYKANGLEDMIDDDGYITLYHGGKFKGDTIKATDDELFFLTNNKDEALDYATKNKGKVVEIKTRPEFVSYNTGSNEWEISTTLKKLRDPETLEEIYAPELTKSQLEEIWKKANQATPESSLINEAKKYKSAEEFVKAQGTPVYRSGDMTKLSEDTILGKVKFFADKKANAELYGKNVQEAYVDIKNPYIISERAESLGGRGQDQVKIVREMGGTEKFREFLKDNGYDGIKIEKDYGNEIIALDLNQIKTKSQLTDIWEQANEITPETRTTSVPREQLPVSEEGETRVSRLEARMKSVLNNISPEKADEMGVTTYQRMNKDEQIKLASDYVLKNPEDAMAVLRGEKEAPVGLLYNSIALALRETPTVTADANLAIKLASLRSTRAGQEISILTKADPNDPVSAINEIIKARKARVERKTKTTASKAISKEVSELSAEVAKKQLKLTEAEALLAKILC